MTTSPGPKHWSELNFNIGVKCRAVHGRIDDLRCDEAGTLAATVMFW